MAGIKLRGLSGAAAGSASVSRRGGWEARGGEWVERSVRNVDDWEA